MPKGFHSYAVQRRLDGRGPSPGQWLMDLPQVAEALFVSVWTVRGLIWRKELSAVMVGKAYRVHRRDLEAYIEANRVCVPPA